MNQQSLWETTMAWRTRHSLLQGFIDGFAIIGFVFSVFLYAGSVL